MVHRIVREANNNVVFQPQSAQWFTATTSVPQTNDYNLQYQNTSTVSNIANKRTLNSPTVADALYSQSSEFLGVGAQNCNE